jgi:cystathionine beta-lyase/cystathionine gamma-synthase
MIHSNISAFLTSVIQNMPEDWLSLTTHRLDIYNEAQAKTEFLSRFENLLDTQNTQKEVLSELPTAYDYIRLGHPLSSVLEWALAESLGLNADQVISFSSMTMPILAVLRKNNLDQKSTTIYCLTPLSKAFDVEIVKNIYGYQFDIVPINDLSEISVVEQDQAHQTIVVVSPKDIKESSMPANVDFCLQVHPGLGSILCISNKAKAYVGAVQHVRRRESIAMTPADCLTVLNEWLQLDFKKNNPLNGAEDLEKVTKNIKEITQTKITPLLGSSGLSIQYAIMMGLIHHARETYPQKEIKIIIPPNCYGGTNDQARRVAACYNDVEIIDLPVDRDHDMVASTEEVLKKVAESDAVPLIIAEIPTNPRVEVPELDLLGTALHKPRKTKLGNQAVPPVFILDQTFCPNVPFLKEGGHFSAIPTIAYVSGSKFPSGGQCTAGYCVANNQSTTLMDYINIHLKLCDNEASDLQVNILAQQMPSMLNRIHEAYLLTREFVDYIQEALPNAKINFVSKSLADEGFTPSVFSLDLPTKGDTHEEREAYKRKLNHKLIQMMITEIPKESKYCVSYGQLKGCYWTIPATSTQGTTKEKDKDYIARVALSPDLDLDKHKAVFKAFVDLLD